MDTQIKLDQHPLVKKLIRNVPAGDFLFKKGQMGNTIFLILTGRVALTSDRGGQECLIRYVDAGEFIGEKAMIQAEPFKRFSSAKAVSDVVGIELGLAEVTQLEKEAPPLLHTMVKKAFRVAATRIDHLNQLITILRPNDPAMRFLGYLQHLSRTEGKKTLKGLQVEIDRTNIYFYVDIPLATIDQWLADLIAQKVLIAEKDKLYTVTDVDSLLQVEMHVRNAA